MQTRGRQECLVATFGTVAVLAVVLPGFILSLPASHSDLVRPLSLQLNMDLPGQTLSPGALPELVAPSLADDIHDGYVLSFGGFLPPSIPSAITLVYSNGSWSNLTEQLSPAPAARWAAAMAYDPAENEVVLFGGCVTLNCYPALNDTWVFAGDRWTDITNSAGPAPSPRGGAMMAWDAPDGALVLFGGGGGSSPSALYNDTWEFVGNHWTNITAQLSGPSPPARFYGQIASGASGPAVLFGGSDSTGNLADTWTFSNHNWTDLTGTTGSTPTARSEGMFASDPRDGYLLLTGGTGGSGYLSDSWSYASGRWTRVDTEIPGVPSLGGAGITFDSEDGYVVMFGGQNPGCGQTCAAGYYWTYSGGVWTLKNPATAPPLNWLFPILPLVFVSVLIVEMIVVNAFQNRRIRKLEALVPPPDPSRVQWYPTLPKDLVYQNVRRFALIVGGILGSFVVLLALLGVFSLSPSPEGLPFTVGMIAFLVAIPGVMVFVLAGQATRAIGVSDVAVLVRRRWATLRIPWGYLQPPHNAPKGSFLTFHFTPPDRTSTPTGFAVTHDQARAILAHPAAAYWTLPPPVTEALGLEPRAPVLDSGVQAPLPSRRVPDSEAPSEVRPDRKVPSGGFCVRCGQQLPSGGRFCPRCGLVQPDVNE
jgi:hypothetical protein